MNDKFNPAPRDEYAEPAHKAHKKKGDELEQGLAETFPASDPTSATQPGGSKSEQ